MTAYMIYEKEEGEKNKGFIEKFQKEGMQYGISFFFVPKEDYKERPLPDFVLNRTRDALVSLWYEERKVRVLHDSTVVELGNDKWKTFSYLKGNGGAEGIFMADTVSLPGFTKEKLYEKVFDENWHMGEDLVLKTVDGHGGEEVFLLRKEDLYQSIKKMSDDMETAFRTCLKRDCILQERIKSRAEDIRVYILGNQIYHGILRKGGKDFRSNYSLGGRAESYHFSRKEKRVIENCLGAFAGLTLGLAGMDFIVAEDGTLFFNELEEMAGCRMLYAHSEKDIVKDYIRWIAM